MTQSFDTIEAGIMNRFNMDDLLTRMTESNDPEGLMRREIESFISSEKSRVGERANVLDSWFREQAMTRDSQMFGEIIQQTSQGRRLAEDGSWIDPSQERQEATALRQQLRETTGPKQLEQIDLREIQLESERNKLEREFAARQSRFELAGRGIERQGGEEGLRTKGIGVITSVLNVDSAQARRFKAGELNLDDFGY